MSATNGREARRSALRRSAFGGDGRLAMPVLAIPAAVHIMRMAAAAGPAAAVPAAAAAACCWLVAREEKSWRCPGDIRVQHNNTDKAADLGVDTLHTIGRGHTQSDSFTPAASSLVVVASLGGACSVGTCLTARRAHLVTVGLGLVRVKVRVDKG